eukprot:1402684-Prymnesium_polylepis.1
MAGESRETTAKRVQQLMCDCAKRRETCANCVWRLPRIARNVARNARNVRESCVRTSAKRNVPRKMSANP